MQRKNSAQADQSQHPRRKSRRWLKIIVSLIAVMVLALGGLFVIPIVSPAAGAAMADWLRGIIGPEAVAEIEGVAFRLQDAFNRARYDVSGGQAQLSFADDSATPGARPKVDITVIAPRPTLAPALPNQLAAIEPTSVPGQSGQPLPVDPAAATPAQVVNTPFDQNIDWRSFGPSLNRDWPLFRAAVQPDPTRPYAQAALVMVDLKLADLHLLPGTAEPVAVKGTPKFARPGIIPTEVQTSGQLLAAFNGGFKTIHGHYGMMADGTVIVTPTEGLATLALYQDGHVQLGAWGRDITSLDGLSAFRQNCPLLIDQGVINAHVNDESRKEWGYTVKNLDTTWRSGVGMSQDGRYLIYAVGNSLTVQSLAQALQQAGAYYAMQLDINGFYTRFVTYKPASNAQATYPLIANKLLKEMSGDPALFLHPYDRDFFYLTAKPVE